MIKSIPASEFVTGTKLPFYQDTAPNGWILLNTLDDKVLYVTKGSAAGGQTGGTVHNAGTWTVSGLNTDHYHSMSNHNHTTPLLGDQNYTGGAPGPDNTGGLAISVQNSYNTHLITTRDMVSSVPSTDFTSTASSQWAVSNAAWRPDAYCVILAQKR